jgi:hypothetical protein
MDLFLKISAVLLLFVLIIMQLLLISPIAARIYTDDFNGVAIKSRQTTVREGSVTLNALGDYVADSAILIVNGEQVKDIDRFPLTIKLRNGDVVEIYTRKGVTPFYVYVSERSAALDTGLNESSTKINPGVNLVIKAVIAGSAG